MGKLDLTMRQFTCTIRVPKSTEFRLRLFALIVSFAAWVGGFGGVVIERDEKENL